MDDLDALRIEHANSAIAKGHAGLQADPSASYYNIWSGRLLLISTKLKCKGGFPRDDIVALARETVIATSEHGVRLSLEKQNEILVLSLAVGDVDGARQIAQLDCGAGDSNGFDIALNRRLRVFFCECERGIAYTPTVSERGLFSDIDFIAGDRNTDLSSTDNYWSATKAKRYANTAFGIKNLFRPALEQLKGM